MQTNFKHIVIGLGEVGTALTQVFNCEGFDPQKGVLVEGNFDILHIAFPYFEGFARQVDVYKQRFNTQYVVVHSTVPIGTCEQMNANHSPIRGKHPNLAESIKTFKKFIGGPDAKMLTEEFERFGIPTYGVTRARDTEAMKLWDTTQYGAMILLEKEIHDFCKKHDVDFDVVYTEGNRTYNDGYVKMGMPNVQRPVLTHQDGPIGGHCVVPNCKLFDSETPKRIRDMHN